MTDEVQSWVRIDAFLAEKYHYTPGQIYELTPTECLWLCIAWDKEEESLKISEGMDPGLQRLIVQRQEKYILGRQQYHRLPPEEKIRLAEEGVLNDKDYYDAFIDN